MSLPQTQRPRNSLPTTCLTVRSLAIGLTACGLAGLAGPYWTFYMQASSMFTDYNAAGPVFTLVVVMAIFNGLLALGLRRLRLAAGELRAVTAMVLTGGAIVTSGLVAYLIPGMTAPYYHATEANQIRTRVWPYLRSWLFALDPNGGTIAIEKWWAGLRHGEPVPWGPWIMPLICWGIFAMAIFAFMIALMVLMRKQWVDHEHLSFPIAQIPAELCAAAERPTGPESVFRRRAFWCGVGFAVLIGTSRGLGSYFNGLPTFHIRQSISGLGPMELDINVSLVIIGLVFLIPSRVAFSIWFLCLLSWVLRSFIREYDFGMKEWMLYGVVGHPELQHLSMGAFIAFGLGSVWAARQHLRRVVLCVAGRDPGYDRGEPAGYRATFVVMALSMIVMLVWLGLAGLRLHYAIILLLITFVIYYGVARMIAQCGLPAINSPVVPSVWMASIFGSGNLGAEQSVALGGHLMWHADLRNSPMSGAAHGMYLTGRRSGGLFAAMMAGLLVSYVTASLFTIWLGYRHGANTMHPWYIVLSSRLNWMWTASVAEGTADPSYAGMAWTAAGGIVMALLIVAHRSIFWWPLHPVGFLTSGTFLVTAFWFSIFLSWLAKVCLVYVGGGRIYRIARSFFIGAVLGSFVAGGVWAIIDSFLGHTGNAVFAI